MIADLNKTFKNKDLYLEALTHSSWVNENPNKRNSNERLEFLGDAVLELVVTEDLFIKFPLKEEGYLTALRANLVNTKNLARIAKEFELGKELFLSRGERADSDSILADTLEAVIGAIYLDSGLEKASEFIKENILSELSEHLKKPIKSPKSMLQEIAQSKGLGTPRYKVIKSWGPDHAKEFEVEVVINGKQFGKGTGRGKNEAQQTAAEAGLEKLSTKS